MTPATAQVHEDSLRALQAFARDFDEDAYARMTDDGPRVAAYARAIACAGVAGKVVLDLGAGPHALLARLAAAAGAARVVAVEALPQVAEHAREAVRRAGLADRIEVLSGHSAVLALPRVDVVVHEIVGDIATEEGVAACLADLRARPDVVDSSQPGWSLPRRIETLCAPTSLRVARPAAEADAISDTFLDAGEDDLLDAGVGGDAPLEGVESEPPLGASEVVRLPFAPPPCTLLGEPQAMDVVDSESEIELQQSRRLHWRIGAPATLTGVACAPRISLDASGELNIDAWAGGFHWRHVLVLFASPALVEPGDEVRLDIRADLRRFPVVHSISAHLRRRSAADAAEPSAELLGTVEISLDVAGASTVADGASA